jgi:hypothetical protein
LRIKSIKPNFVGIGSINSDVLFKLDVHA